MCSSHLRGFLLVIKEKILVSPAVARGLELFGVLTSNVLYHGKGTTACVIWRCPGYCEPAARTSTQSL